ncbi:MAG: cell division protein FtsL [Acidobacteriota bacterium]
MRSPYTIHRQVENTYLVRERDRRLIRELLAVVAVVLLLGGGLLAYTWVHIEILDTGYRIDHYEKELHQLRQEERRRRLEASYLAHPARIEQRASQDLGMAQPGLAQTLFFEELVQ